MTKFAIIKTGGKQYKIAEGDVLSIEKLPTANGKIDFDSVLLVANDKDIKIGQPAVPGARVTANILANGKGDKKIVFRYKNKIRYHKKKGHRQPFTQVQITKITA